MNPKCLRLSYHIQLMSFTPVRTHAAAFCVEYAPYRRNTLEMWLNTLLPAGLGRGSPLVSRGRLPVFALQLSGQTLAL